ncbi:MULTISPECIES: lipopolysaccharide biosynthesis protein [unclassified Nocardiopsis]|uniref:lipopolysaccharide biosynthesis protein n=1 Tax=unclassified Nocardiopsis TaxID=2649073 RepID=UPI001F2B234D|nr:MULTISPECIES: polysaccharide biosynthesis C-terminal domain-containing protein [unclassified Nocardiopsis]
MGAHALVAGVSAVAEGSGLRRVLRGGAVNMAGAAVGAALNLALIVAVTRAFSQETAGLLFAATSVFLLAAAVANLGAPDGLVYFIARMRVLGGRGGVPRLLRLASGPAVLAACAAAVLLLVLAGPLGGALGGGDAEVYLRLLALFLPFAVLTETALAATRAHHDMSGTVLVDKVGRPLAQVALVGTVAVTGSAGLLALAWAGPYLPAALLAWCWLGGVLRRTAAEAARNEGGPAGAEPERPAPPRAPGTAAGAPRSAAAPGGAPVGTVPERASPGVVSATETVAVEIKENKGFSGTPGDLVAEGPVDARTFWSFALPRAAAGVAQMGVQRGGVVLVALLGGLTGAAVFTAATRIMVVGQFGTQAVLYAAQPRFAEQLAADDHEGVRSLYQAGAAWLVCLLWPLYLSVLVFAPEVMRLFGPDYATGVTALVVVCSGQLLAAALGMGDVVLAMTGRTRLNLLNNVLSLAVNVLVCVALVPVAGAAGAALALVAAMLVRKVSPLWQLRSSVALHPFHRPVAVAAASTLVWFGALPLAVGAASGGGIAALAAAVAAGTLGHLGTVWSLRRTLALSTRR